MNTALTMSIVRKQITKLLEGYVFEINDDRTRLSISKSLDEYLKSHFKDYTITCVNRSVNRSWESIYPNLVKRVLARIADYCIRKGWMKNHYSNTFTIHRRWYHYIFPFTYKIELKPVSLEDLKIKWFYSSVSDENEKFNCDFEKSINTIWVKYPPSTEWIINNTFPKLNHSVILDNPNKYLDIDVVISPKSAIDKIPISFTITY